MSHPKRMARAYRVRCWTARAAAVLATCAALAAAPSSGVASATLLALAAVLAVCGVVFARRAARYTIGADSEDLVAACLAPLARKGWSVSHSIRWPGRGDIDHVVQSPARVSFVVETKTSRYEQSHLDRTLAAAHSLSRPGRPCAPVLCLARRRGVTHQAHGVHVVSADRITGHLQRLSPTDVFEGIPEPVPSRHPV